MEKAAVTAVELGRTRLASLLRGEVVRRREQGEGIRLIYELVKEWVQSVPDVTLPQLESALAEENGVTVPELHQRLRRLEKVFREAKSDVLEARRMKAKLMAAAKRG
jgi:acyl carrier protein phosphodiesterase